MQDKSRLPASVQRTAPAAHTGADSFTDVLQTIAKGDTFDHDDIIVRITDSLEKRAVSPLHYKLCCQVIDIAIRHPKKNIGHPTIEACVALVKNPPSDTPDALADALDLVGKNIKATKDTSYFLHDMTLNVDESFWDHAVDICAKDDCKQSLAACTNLCKTLADMPMLAENAFKNLKGEIRESVDMLAVAKEFQTNTKDDEKQIAIGLSLVGVFAESKNEKLAKAAKNYLLQFFIDHPDTDPKANPARPLTGYLPQ